MGSPPMVTRNISTARMLGVAASTLALSMGTTALPSGQAHAADTITAADQPYFAYYHLDQARAKGYTGQGVTIAILDGEVDTSAPELAGADITDKSPCTVTSSVQSKEHGTDVASVLVARDYGIAPQAKLLTYRVSYTDAGDTAGADCKVADGNDKDDMQEQETKEKTKEASPMIDGLVLSVSVPLMSMGTSKTTPRGAKASSALRWVDLSP